MDSITLTRPDDWHLHLRDGEVLADVVPASARQFGRAIIMPNLTPPVTDVDAAEAYRRRILEQVPPGSGFTPLMTLYLTDNTTGQMVEAAAASGAVHAVKLYPAGATTNSDSGVTDLGRCDEALAAMAAAGLPLLVHGEVTTSGVDIFDRERVFLEERLAPLLERHPQLKVVLEHVTTAAGVRFVEQGPERLAGTLTAHHLLLNRNDLLVGGIRPHHYCLPVLKRETDREALLAAATSGNPKFFLGTDSAPHPRSAKENPCGCAGIYTAPYALALYAEAFEAAGALNRLEGFAAHHGPDFYGLPRNGERIRLVRDPEPVPEDLPLGSGRIVPLRAGGRVAWRLADEGEGPVGRV
ncbi:dihydroorotase [Arhodomonas sp. SL1]|uniref:dihydroorotase n=1 Tax=Arhodomonas sp. SL1 TaxID=3425691 RepID=UPI003F881FEF